MPPERASVSIAAYLRLRQMAAVPPGGATRSRCLTVLASFIFLLIANAPAKALESRHFVLGWFALAVNLPEGDCKDVPHGSPLVVARKNLLMMGYSEAEAQR